MLILRLKQCLKEMLLKYPLCDENVLVTRKGLFPRPHPDPISTESECGEVWR